MNPNGILRQGAERFVFDEENCDGKLSKVKRRNRCSYYLYYIIIPSVVTIITFVLMVVIDRKLIPLWSHPLINSSSAETTSYQLSRTEALMAVEDTKPDTRASAHLCNNTISPNKTSERRASAHLFYNPNSNNKSSGNNSCVMWDNSIPDSFVSEGIIFKRDTSSLQVIESGVYQVYSKLTLKNEETKSTREMPSDLYYSVLLKNGVQLTMEQFRLPPPGKNNMYHVLHFGIYILNAGDELCVTISSDIANYIWSRARASFFGLNLISPI